MNAPEKPTSFLRIVAERKAATHPNTTTTATTTTTTIKSGDDRYTAKAISNEISALAAMPPNSGRNSQLNTAALKLGKLPIPRQELHDLLIGACRSNGLLAEDGMKACSDTIDSGFKKADQDGPRTIPERRPPTITITDTDTADPTAKLEQIEQDFWDSRPELTLIYQAALARMASPWAVLACCAARTLTLIPPTLTLPPIIGGRGSLNWFAAIAAKSGGGKGAAMTVSEQLIPDPITIHGIGSGEGMIETYRRSGEPEDAITAVMFSVDEIDTLGAMRGRSGQTTMTILRQGFSGERLGFSYRSRHSEHVPAHSYRMTLITAIQPGRAGVLFDDAAGGTPQRFQWFPGRDKRITATPPHWPTTAAGTPQLLTLTPLADIATTLVGDIAVPDTVAATIRNARAASMRGDDIALDGHALFCREKFAFFLAYINGRTGITDDDWRLAGIAADVSDWCRTRVHAAWLDEQGRQSRERGALRAVENDERGIVEQLTLSRHLARITDWVAKTLTAHGPMTNGELNKRAPSRDRTRLHQAISAAVETGLIGLNSDGHWTLK